MQRGSSTIAQTKTKTCYQSDFTLTSCRHGQSWLLKSRPQSRKRSWKNIQSRYDAATVVDRKGQLPGRLPNKDLQRGSSTMAQAKTKTCDQSDFTHTSGRHGQRWLLKSRPQGRKRSWKNLQSRHEPGTVVDKKGLLPGRMPNKTVQRGSSTIAQTKTKTCRGCLRPTRHEATTPDQ